MMAYPDSDTVADALANSLLDSYWLDEHTYDLPFGSELVAVLDSDPYSDIISESGQGVWCGSLSHAYRDHYSGRTESRPDGFTGAAEILYIGRSADPVWWEPPEDMRTPGPNRDSLRSTVVRILEDGYSTLTLSHRLAGRTLATASMSGIEPDLDPSDMSDILSDLYSEVCYR